MEVSRVFVLVLNFSFPGDRIKSVDLVLVFMLHLFHSRVRLDWTKQRAPGKHWAPK